MAHFAKIVDGVVVDVHVVVNEALEHDGKFPESEPSGQAFLASLGFGDNWLQTSYNGNFRGKYAAIGDTYDAELDQFISVTQSEVSNETA